MTRCVDCGHFDMLSAGPALFKLGMGYCKAIPITKGEFVTATYARECTRFKPASAETVAKRHAILAVQKPVAAA